MNQARQLPNHHSSEELHANILGSISEDLNLDRKANNDSMVSSANDIKRIVGLLERVKDSIS